MDADKTPSEPREFELHPEHSSLVEPVSSERAMFELDPEVAKARRSERKASSFQLPPDRPLSFFRKAKLLFFAAALGSLYHWLPLHHSHVPGFGIQHTEPAPEQPRPEPRKVPVGNRAVAQPENLDPYPVMPRSFTPPIYKPIPQAPSQNYPPELSPIISPSDWPYVRSALVVAFGFGAHPQLVRWSNPHNAHDGSVTSTGIKENGDGCLQFRVTRQIHNGQDNAPRIAQVLFCRDGTVQ